MAEDSDRDIAAILLMLLEEGDAATIVGKLAPREIERIGSAMFALGPLEEARIAGALDRFVANAREASDVLVDVEDHVSGVVTRALGANRAPAMLDRIVPATHQEPLPTLKWLSVDDLKLVVENEHPQFVALIIAHVDPAIAAVALSGLGETEQADILYRAATLGPVSASAFAEADALLAEAIGRAGQSRTATAGSPAVAAILNRAAKPTDQRVLRALAKRDRSLAQKIEDEMVVFDDILALADKDLGLVCRTAQSDDLALALKGTTEADRERIFATMSARAADTMRDAIAEQGPAKIADVQLAQRAIIEVARALGEAGSIKLGHGSDDYV